MKKSLHLAIGILALLYQTLVHAVDLNENGYSDIWEQHYNASHLDPAEDEDNDGFSTGDEATAGTNPFDPDSYPKAMVFQTNDDGAPQAVMFPTQPGKWYQLQQSRDLSGFTAAGEPLNGHGGMVSLKVGASEGILQDGLIQEEFWADIPGSDLTALRNHPNFPAQPDFRATCESFDILPGAATSYGTRLTALILPPQTGEYRFYISAGSSALLSISENTEESELRSIASISPEEADIQRNVFDQYDSQESLPVQLTQGQAVLLELQFLASRPNSHCQVAWTGPGFASPEIIPASALVPVPVIAGHLIPQQIFSEDYDAAGASPIFGSGTQLVPGLSGTGQAERILSDPNREDDSIIFPVTTDAHFYAAWTFMMTEGAAGERHNRLTMTFSNPDDIVGEDGPFIEYRTRTTGEPFLRLRGETRTTNYDFNLNTPYRIEIIASLDEAGFDYRTGLVSRRVEADRFDFYMSTLDGKLIHRVEGLVFADLGENVVQKLGHLQISSISSPQMIFDDWEITNGSIIGSAYLDSNRNGFDVQADRHFFRVSVSDGDQDNDGLTDWEEKILGKHQPFLLFDDSSGNDPGGDMARAMGLLQTMGEAATVSLATTNLDAYERGSSGPSRNHGEITLTRTGAVSPLTVSLEMAPLSSAGEATVVCDGLCCSLRGSSGDEAAEAEDFAITDREGNPVSLESVTFELGEMTKTLTISALPDEIAEYPETLVLKLVDHTGYSVSSDSNTASIQLIDLPDAPGNEALFTGSFSLEPGATVTGPLASGSITAILNGPRTELRISTNIALENLSSAQQDSHVHKSLLNDSAISRGPIIFEIVDETSTEDPKPPLNGLLEDHLWNICETPGAVPTAGGPASKQTVIDSLFGQNGETPLYLNLHTVTNPGGEIWAFLNLSGGSKTEPSPPEPDVDPGSGAFPLLTGDELEEDVRRFLNQATFGSTTADVEDLLSRIATARLADPSIHRIEIFSTWLDEQMALPQSYHLDFLMAKNWQHLKTQGIFDPARYIPNADFPTPVMPSPWPSIVRENPDPSLFHLSAPYPLTRNEYQRADGNELDLRPRMRESNARAVYWQMMLNARDQLRQKMGFALQQILVVSYVDSGLRSHFFGTTNYQDQINARAFGHYRKVLGYVNWSPIMGRWLSSLQNQKATDLDGDGQADIFPDENLARENMQLFSIGLFQIWPDGTLKLDENGRPQATYSNEDIRQFAKVLTGQSFSRANANNVPWGGVPYDQIPENMEFSPRPQIEGYYHMDFLYPMKMFGEFHDTSAKTFAGVTIDNTELTDPSQQGIADIKDALDWLAGNPDDPAADYDMVSSHVSTPAFISLRLIQRFVTSNPSRDYLHRVATVFKESQGHLGLTLKAILLDSEARILRRNSATFGHKRSPLELYMQILRSFDAFSFLPISPPDTLQKPFSDADASVSYSDPDLFLSNFGLPASQLANQVRNIRFIGDDTTNFNNSALQMDPMRQETVFNYYLPDYSPGGAAGDAGLVAPELQLANEQDIIRNINYIQNITRSTRGVRTDPIGDQSSVINELFGIMDGSFQSHHYIRLPLQDMADSLYPASAPAPSGTRSSESIADEILVDALDRIMTGGELKRNYPYDPGTPDNKRDGIITALSAYNDPFNGNRDDSDRLGKLTTALYLIATTPEFQTKQ